MPLRWHGFGRKTRVQSSSGTGQGVELSSADRSHQTWLEVNVVLDFYNLGSGWVRHWVFGEESNKPTILRENVGRTQTFKLPGDVGANCWVRLKVSTKTCVPSVQLWSLEAAGLFMHMHVLREKCKAGSEKHYFALRMAGLQTKELHAGLVGKRNTVPIGKGHPAHPGQAGLAPLFPP